MIGSGCLSLIFHFCYPITLASGYRWKVETAIFNWYAFSVNYIFCIWLVGDVDWRHNYKDVVADWSVFSCGNLRGNRVGSLSRHRRFGDNQGIIGSGERQLYSRFRLIFRRNRMHLECREDFGVGGVWHLSPCRLSLVLTGGLPGNCDRVVVLLGLRVYVHCGSDHGLWTRALAFCWGSSGYD